MTEADVLLEAMRDANRYACYAMASLADLKSTTVTRKIERDLQRALDVLQAEIDEEPEA